jgi:hypothetical protein
MKKNPSDQRDQRISSRYDIDQFFPVGRRGCPINIMDSYGLIGKADNIIFIGHIYF